MLSLFKDIFIYLGVFTSLLQSFFIVIPVLCLFNIHHYRIRKFDNILIIRKKIKNAFIFDDFLLPIGLFYGKYFIGYIYEDSIVIFCSQKRFEKLLENEIMESYYLSESTQSNTQKDIDLYVKCSNSYTWCSYNKRKVYFEYAPFDQQKKIIDEIVDYYHKNKFCVSFIDGEYGSGKTTIAFLLANILKASICKSYSPIIPGDNLDMLYNDIRPSFDNPLIILLDEVDILFEKIYNESVTLHKNIPIQVYNKTTWNSLLDDFQLKLYPFVILILISNKNIEMIKHDYDPSYIRENRVNLFFSMNSEIENDENIYYDFDDRQTF